ncbi:MAG: flavodoxin-dependent (E)-4-hydroxy-3-methylbut-2-enyl-diphosphate synthase [Ruminococcaceae bacterium]|nr:flavodoxin-dependent (E)-4-hydroxy-3-methylbut-2-enyl-diphosphate synthase [Oscillospiraceae bacterium]
MNRRTSRQITVGGVKIGGDAPITVQSMTNTDTRDAAATIAQIKRLSDAGCEIVRCAVPDMDAVRAIHEIKAASPIPVVADIHFNYRLAIECVAAGVDKIRINPGNIGGRDRVRAVVAACRGAGVPIRIGVNSGSVEKDLHEQFPHDLPRAMAESAMRHVRLLEAEDFTDIAVSLKASDVPNTIAAYQDMAQRCDYPLHVGVTHAGTLRMGSIKGAAGIGGLLAMGIGDTLRVSLAADPVEEVKLGLSILRAVGLRRDCPEVVACPTCGRCQVDLLPLAEAVEEAVADIHSPIKIAVMGCAVNGPGEGREADIGVACGKNDGLLFKNGEILHKVPFEEIVPALLSMAREWEKERMT